MERDVLRSADFREQVVKYVPALCCINLSTLRTASCSRAELYLPMDKTVPLHLRKPCFSFPVTHRSLTSPCSCCTSYTSEGVPIQSLFPPVSVTRNCICCIYPAEHESRLYLIRGAITVTRKERQKLLHLGRKEVGNGLSLSPFCLARWQIHFVSTVNSHLKLSTVKCYMRF